MQIKFLITLILNAPVPVACKSRFSQIFRFIPSWPSFIICIDFMVINFLQSLMIIG